MAFAELGERAAGALDVRGLQAMMMSKLKMTSVFVAVLCLAGIGVGLGIRQAFKDKPEVADERIQSSGTGPPSSSERGTLRTSSHDKSWRDVPPEANPKDGVWVMDFRFEDPCPLVLDVPGRGKKVVWYMRYEVINHTNEPRYFIPDFKLVTLDKVPHDDQVLPKAEEAIKRIADPTRELDIMNTVTVVRKPIPVSQPGLSKRAVNGVAVWGDLGEQPHSVAGFTILVTGLSNDFKVAQGIVQRKTLQLTFKRSRDGGKMEFVSPGQWLYLQAERRAGP